MIVAILIYLCGVMATYYLAAKDFKRISPLDKSVRIFLIKYSAFSWLAVPGPLIALIDHKIKK